MNHDDVKAFVGFVELLLRKQFENVRHVGVGDIARATERVKQAMPEDFELDVGAENTIILTVARNLGLV